MQGYSRLFSVLALAAVLLSLGGCVVRPLWWGGNGHYGDRHDGDRGDRGDRDGGHRRR